MFFLACLYQTRLTIAFNAGHVCIQTSRIHFQTEAVLQFQGARVPAMLSLDLLTWRMLKMGMPKARSTSSQNLFIHVDWKSFGFVEKKNPVCSLQAFALCILLLHWIDGQFNLEEDLWIKLFFT